MQSSRGRCVLKGDCLEASGPTEPCAWPITLVIKIIGRPIASAGKCDIRNVAHRARAANSRGKEGSARRLDLPGSSTGDRARTRRRRRSYSKCPAFLASQPAPKPAQPTGLIIVMKPRTDFPRVWDSRATYRSSSLRRQLTGVRPAGNTTTTSWFTVSPASARRCARTFTLVQSTAILLDRSHSRYRFKPTSKPTVGS